MEAEQNNYRQPRPVAEDKSLIDEGVDFFKKLNKVSGDFLSIIFKVGLGCSIVVLLYRWLLPSEQTQPQKVPTQQQVTGNTPLPEITTKSEKTHAGPRHSSSVPPSNVVVVRDTIREFVEKPMQPQATREEIVILESSNGRKIPLRASRKNDTLHLKEIESAIPADDSLLGKKESVAETSDADINMIGRRELKLKPTIRASNPKLMRRHLVAPGDTLGRVAKIYGITKEALMKENHKTRDYVKRGEWLNIPYPEKYINKQ